MDQRKETNEELQQTYFQLRRRFRGTGRGEGRKWSEIKEKEVKKEL